MFKYRLMINFTGLAYGLVHPIIVRLNSVGRNRETDEEHDEDCVEEGFHLARVKFYRNDKRGREAVGMGYCSGNT